MSGGRYPVLRSLAILYLLGAALAAAATIVAAAYILVRVPFAFTDRCIMAIGALVAGFFVVLSILAIAEVLKLFIDLEHNTRMAAPGRIGMAQNMAPSAADMASADGNSRGANRLDLLDEETAEAALLRGH